MNNTVFDWSHPQRQSPAALFIIFFKVVKNMIRLLWPVLLFYFIRGSKGNVNTWELIIAILPVFLLIRAVLEFISFRFYIAGSELFIKKGIFRKQTITIPLEKIQAVHIEQSFLHIWTGTAKIAFDSAGTEKLEVKIDAVLLAKAENMKKFILQSGVIHNDGTAQASENNIITLQWDYLLKLSFTSNHIEAFFILLGFILSVFNNLKDLFKDQLNELFQETSLLFINSNMGIFLAVLMLSLFVSVIISTAKTFLAYFHFYISSNGNGFRIHSGLINVKEKVVPFKKIQYISWKANWLRNKIGLSLLQFHAIGGDQIKQRQQVKAPVTRYSFISVLTQPYYSLAEATRGSRHQMHPSYAFRRMIWPALPYSLLPVLLVWSWWQWYALAFLLFLPYSYLSAFIAVKRFRLLLGEETLFIHKGVFGMEEILLKWNNIQQTTIQQSIYQRRHQVATLKLHTAGGVITIPFITLDLALRIFNYSLYKIESGKLVWM